MKVIFKYELPFVGPNKIQMPKDCKILSVESQYCEVYLYVWAMVDTEQPMVDYFFNVIGTGIELKKDIWKYKYLSTVQMAEKVWHVFIKDVP